MRREITNTTSEHIPLITSLKQQNSLGDIPIENTSLKDNCFYVRLLAARGLLCPNFPAIIQAEIILYLNSKVMVNITTQHLSMKENLQWGDKNSLVYEIPESIQSPLPISQWSIEINLRQTNEYQNSSRSLGHVSLPADLLVYIRDQISFLIYTDALV